MKTRGPNITAEQEEKLFAQMRYHDAAYDSMLKSMSGADQADAEGERICRLFYGALWEGTDIETALTSCEQMWRDYAEKNNARVNAAPKTSRGPYQGQSVIHYRWTSPERFLHSAIHLRTMAALFGIGVKGDPQR